MPHPQQYSDPAAVRQARLIAECNAAFKRTEAGRRNAQTRTRFEEANYLAQKAARKQQGDKMKNIAGQKTLREAARTGYANQTRARTRLIHLGNPYVASFLPRPSFVELADSRHECISLDCSPMFIVFVLKTSILYCSRTLYA